MDQLIEQNNQLKTNPLQPIDKAFRLVFGNNEEETKLQRAKRLMGKEVLSLTDEDLEVFITEFEYLIDNWLDDFERLSFDGLTLKELLQE